MIENDICVNIRFKIEKIIIKKNKNTSNIQNGNHKLHSVDQIFFFGISF